MVIYVGTFRIDLPQAHVAYNGVYVRTRLRFLRDQNQHQSGNELKADCPQSHVSVQYLEAN